MPASLRPLALFAVVVLGACFPPALELCDDDCTSPPESTTGEPVTPTSGGGSDDIQTVTGEPDSSSTGEGSTGTTGGSPELAPVIVEVEVDPNPIEKNGLIAIDVDVEHADGVRMKLEDGDEFELAAVGPGSFQGHIPSFTGLDNGGHVAALTPWRDVIDGRKVDAPYTIGLPEPGSQGFWETGDIVGGGNVAALGVLLDGSLVEFGTYFEDGEPRCYLRRRDHNGAWFLEDFVSPLPGVHCTAIDMKIDPEVGTLRILLDRKGGDGVRWWVGEIASWGKGAKQIGLGAIGDNAEALAQQAGVVAVCGGKQTLTLDLDAAVWLHRTNSSVETHLFDYWPNDGMKQPHRFDETAHDCVFAGDILVLVGEAFGKHSDGEAIKRDRRFVLEYDSTSNDEGAWTVGGAGSGTQSRALAVDVDDQGRYLITGYTCGDACEPDGEVRIHLPGGKLQWQAPLGPLGLVLAGPHDIAWSPAGYLVIALAEFDGQTLRFKVQAFDPGSAEPLWTYMPADAQGLQVALALAIGTYGEVYAGGVGAGNYPAVAYIPG